MRAARPAPGRRRQRGAALLLAMLILTIVATLCAAMVWQQWRGIEVESAERERAQGTWLLTGALDWARLILREDARNAGPDHLGEPWATPLAESRLSTFLAAGQDPSHTTDDTAAGIDAFMSGQITDAQARYNLQNLIDTEENAQKDLAAFKRLCDALSLPGDTANRIAQNFRLSNSVIEDVDAAAPSDKAGRNALLIPQKVSELSWYGIEPEIIQTLEPYVVILPQRTPVNANTAPAQVLMTIADGVDRGTAERIVQARQAKPFQTLDDVKALLPQTVQQITQNDVDVHTSWFEVTGQLRYEEHVLRQRTLVQRRSLDVNVVRTERLPPEEK